ncbi:SGNH hydrolase [Hyaloscypha bicolor E]|uniref:SGNH hydrolase n=1 Tax=Hyaloscypha bicolor E TaxID=1095630 RepID=A0A2J6TGJ1_9HELO|nr:SGNH hydrolase [Hyaloscypha bicolor E]PMD62140.1 SGNH hydrolase [Hyaloscypha bicolor E]
MSTISEIAKVTVDKILLFGDSITEMSYNQEFGFNLAPALQHEYFRKLQVVARGYGHQWVLILLYVVTLYFLKVEEAGGSIIRLMTIFFGTNDAGVDAVSLERFAVNLTFIAKMVVGREIPLIIVGPAPINEYVDVAGKVTMRNLEYSNAASKVASELGVPFIDLWHAFLESKGWIEGDPIPGKRGDKSGQTLDDLLSDGVHFTGKGYKLWYNLLFQTIRDRYPELGTEKLSTILPHIFDVDNSDLPASLWQDVKEEKLKVGTEIKSEL